MCLILPNHFYLKKASSYIKSPLELTNRRGDVYGAACVAAVCKAVASMRLPVNIRALIPLCEHMIGAAAIKPGDIFKSINGKSIEIQVKSLFSLIIVLNFNNKIQNYAGYS